jgi:peptide/nickel transport system permease protein
VATTPSASALSPRRMAWVRRRRALAGYWRVFRRNRQGVAGLFILAFFVLLAVFGPLLVDQQQLDPATATGPILHPPTVGYPLGTDNFGRSVLDLVIAGARVSLLVGFAATLGAMIIGASVGITAGYFGGTKVDTVLNAVTNWFLVLPWIVLAIVLASILGPTLLNIIIVIAITSWAGTARLVRSQALTVRERPYVERARALGSGHWHLVTRHILPNVFPVLFANAILTVALSILSETTLSILGLGDPGSVSWGQTIEAAFTHGAMTAGYWWWLIPPGVAIVMVTLSFTMCGYALDEILNPRLRTR